MWLIYAVTAALVWGLDYALTERIFENKISPITILAAQMLIAPFLFLIVGFSAPLRKNIEIIFTKTPLLIMLILVVITFNMANFLMFLSIQEKNATIAGLIELCYPLFTAVFTFVLFKENHLNLPVVFGAILIFAGAGIVSYFS